MNARPYVPAAGRSQIEQVRLDELETGRLRRRPRPRRAGARARASPGRGRPPVTSWPAAASGTASRPVPAAELEDRAAGPRGEGEVEVEVAGILDEVDVVEAGEGVAPRRRSAASRCGHQPRGSRTGSCAPARSLDRERADRLERRPVGDHRRRLGVVVRRRDLDDVHAGELDRADDPADRPEQLAGQQPARLRRARARREPGVDDVDVDAQVDRVGAVERLGDRVVDRPPRRRAPRSRS